MEVTDTPYYTKVNRYFFSKIMVKTIDKNSPIIGIDLGTTYCCVGYLHSNGVVEIIENKEGHKTTPSYVGFTDEGEIIGRVAKEMMFRKPENVVYDSKRLIGQKFGCNFMESARKHNWPFKIASDVDDNLFIEITHHGKAKIYKPQYISVILLKYMQTIAEERLDTEVKDAVITVPAHFTSHQRTATKEAGELAGLNVLKIINERTAAALAYVHKNEINGENTNVLVFDLGGGTFDVSIVTVEGKSVTVKATAGNTALGGRDFDNNLSEFIATKIENKCKKNIKSNFTAMRRIREKSEKIKVDLTSKTKAYLDLAALVDDDDIDVEITRNDFEQINNDLFQVCIKTVEDCLRDAKLTKTEIDRIVLVGGSTRIPKINEMLMNFFQGKQLTKAINPDEAVAYGAAVQASLFTKGNKAEANYEVIDLTPLSLGINVCEGLMDIIIPRNSQIPISKTVSYCTVMNKQLIGRISIYEGERSLIRYNTLLGETELKFPPKPVGYPLEVTFHINSNGIIEVSAKTANGDYTSLAITYAKADIHKTSNILKDAKINKVKDNQSFKIVEEWNKLHGYNEMMKSLCDYDKKGITNKEKIKIGNICWKLTIWLAKNSVEDDIPQGKTAILEKIKEMEALFEPIVNPYGYYVKDMHVHEFYKLITK